MRTTSTRIPEVGLGATPGASDFSAAAAVHGGEIRQWGVARKSGRLGVPSFDCMQIRVADSQSRTPGWVSVNAFAHVQLRERACARAPVVCPLVDTFGAAREE